MFENLTFTGLIAKGGLTVIVLGFLSVISIALILERAWAFHRFRKNLREFFVTLRQSVQSGGAAVGASLCASSSSPLAPVFLAGYRKKGRGRQEVSDAMELAGRTELSRLERFLGVLGTIGSTSPFIGLFGTVLGIIRAFSDLSASQGVGPAAVSEGIAEALIATAAGLFVAIPAVMAYNYYVRTVSRYALEMETFATELTDSIAETKDGMEAKR